MNLFYTLSAQVKNQVDLLQAGLNPEEAARIAFEPLREAQQEVDSDRFNEALRRMFTWGQMHQLKVDNKSAIQSDYEAMEMALNEVKGIL